LRNRGRGGRGNGMTVYGKKPTQPIRIIIDQEGERTTKRGRRNDLVAKW